MSQEDFNDGYQNGEQPPAESIREDLYRIVFEANLGRSIDDFNINYSQPASAASSHILPDREEIAKYLDDYRPFKSQKDIYDDNSAQQDNFDSVDQMLQGRRRWRIMKVIKKKLSDIFVRNFYMQKLYPSLKI